VLFINILERSPNESVRLRKWECYRCSYVFEGETTPEECPNCHYSLTFWLEKVEQKPITVKNFVKTDYLSIDSNETAWKAARAMREKNVGNIIVTVKNEPVGIVTERDILNKVASEDLPASQILVRKIMTSPLITVPADAPLTEGVRLMAKHHIRALVVTENGKVLGLLNQRAIIGDQFRAAKPIGSDDTG
jgi:CBS domain-containing protein